MSDLIRSSIKKILEDNCLKNDFYSYFKFYERLRGLSNVQAIYKELQQWLEITYDIKHLKITIRALLDKTEEIAYQNGDDAVYNEALSSTYDVDMNSNISISFTLMANDEKHHKELVSKERYISTLFYMIAPLISTVSYQALVKDLSLKDTLTNAYNRKFLIEHLSKVLPLAKRESKNVAFLMVGIDHYKAVIDEFDYSIGDKVIINLANVLQENVRESDLVVRLESDEFFIVLYGITEQKDAEYVAQKLIDSFAQSEVVVNEEGQVLKKTICVGITQYDHDIESSNEILKNADISLYEAKNLGRGRFLTYKPEQENTVELF